jgi:prepilin-type N-terminal cleavage/methylation domain-containing protein
MFPLFRPFRKKTSERGFTLVELMVVVMIVAIIAKIVLSSVNQSRAITRDKIRKDALVQLKMALEAYFDANGSYPSTGDTYNASTNTWTLTWYTSEPGFPNLSNGPGNNGIWIPGLAPTYISALPRDPDSSKVGPGVCTSLTNPKASYLYTSDGRHYSVGSICSGETGFRITDQFAIDTPTIHRWQYMWTICNDRISCAW